MNYSRLFHVVSLGLEKEAENRHRPLNAPEKVLGPGLDLEYETDLPTSAPEPALYEPVAQRLPSGLKAPARQLPLWLVT